MTTYNFSYKKDNGELITVSTYYQSFGELIELLNNKPEVSYAAWAINSNGGEKQLVYGRDKQSIKGHATKLGCNLIFGTGRGADMMLRGIGFKGHGMFNPDEPGKLLKQLTTNR